MMINNKERQERIEAIREANEEFDCSAQEVLALDDDYNMEYWD